MRRFYLFFLFFISAKMALAQTSVSNIHLLVEQQKKEFKLQETARNNQTAVNLSEEQNKTLLNKLHNKYEDIQDRYSQLALAIDAARIGLKAQPIVNNIIANQKIILREAYNDPVLIAVAFQSEKKFVDEGQMLIRYLVGVVVSVGDIYSLKPSDRYILFEHIVDELYKLDHVTRRLASSMVFHNKQALLKNLNPFQEFIAQDKRIVNDIMNNWKFLKD